MELVKQFTYLAAVPIAAISLLALASAYNSFFQLPLLSSCIGNSCSSIGSLGIGLMWGVALVIVAFFVYIFVIGSEVRSKSNYI